MHWDGVLPCWVQPIHKTQATRKRMYDQASYRKSVDVINFRLMRALLCLLLVLIGLGAVAEAAPKHKKKKTSEDLLTAPLNETPAAAPAVEPGQKVDSDAIKQGLAAYDDLDYAKCVDLLQKALGETLTRDEKIITYRTLAFCHVGLDKPEAAKFDFEHLLRIDDGYELDRRISPRIRAPFEEAKAAIATGESVDGEASEVQFKTPAVAPTVTPAHPVENQAVTVAAQLDDPRAARAELFYRVKGRAVFNKSATPGSNGKFALTIPGLQVQPPALEYYLSILDDSNTALAHAGSLAQPLWLNVGALKKPIYTKGWFWGVIAGVVIAGAVVGGVAGGLAAASSNNNVAPNTPATVTINPL
jgi:hypothetical protein